MPPPESVPTRGYKRPSLDLSDESEFPAIHPSPRQLPQLPQSTMPVFIKLMDDRPNFRNMKIAERHAFNADLVRLLGRPPLDAQLLRGGDLLIKPTDRAQQELLLSLGECAKRAISCSMPKALSAFKGIIRGVPTADSNDEITDALSDQGVVDAFRFSNRDATSSPSNSVVLTFSGKPPSKVFLASVSFLVEPFYPSPFRCRICWRLGHTKKNCSLAGLDPRCKRCGLEHVQGAPCVAKCVNCNKRDHEADSADCPAFRDAKTVLRIAAVENISVKDARSRFDALYSSRSKPSVQLTSSGRQEQVRLQSNLPVAVPQDFEKLRADVAALQVGMKTVNEVTIPSIRSSITKLSSSLAEAVGKISNFDRRFDRLEELLSPSSPRLASVNPTSLSESPALHQSQLNQPRTSVMLHSIAQSPASNENVVYPDSHPFSWPLNTDVEIDST